MIIGLLCSEVNACEIVCADKCSSSGRYSSCHKVCECDKGTLLSPIAAYGKIHYFPAALPQEEKWVARQLGCDLQVLENCMELWRGEQKLTCLRIIGCEELLISPREERTTQLNSATDCVSFCADFCVMLQGATLNCQVECINKFCSLTNLKDKFRAKENGIRLYVGVLGLLVISYGAYKYFKTKKTPNSTYTKLG